MQKNGIITSKSLEDTERIALDFLKNLEPMKDMATVVGLYGNLGSGKTTFVQAIARALGVSENVVSPTFLILKTYKLKNLQTYQLLSHIDAYRLEKSEEIQSKNST